jgi:hypothetical protein
LVRQRPCAALAMQFGNPVHVYTAEVDTGKRAQRFVRAP